MARVLFWPSHGSEATYSVVRLSGTRKWQRLYVSRNMIEVEPEVNLCMVYTTVSFPDPYCGRSGAAWRVAWGNKSKQLYVVGYALGYSS